jgi:poly(A) polymerase/tRNA nucleotidyltransferase (CCA-adding enzyme)
LRAVRFVHQLGFALEQETATQIKRMGTTVKLASPERQRDELWKLFATPEPAAALRDLQTLGLLAYVLPEVDQLTGIEQTPPHDANVFAHTVRVVDGAAQMRNWLATEHLPAPNAAYPLSPAPWEETLLPWRARLQQHFAQPLAVERLRRDWLVWHALLHDVGKPATRSVEKDGVGGHRVRFLQHERIGAEMVGQRLEQLRFSRPEIVLARTVVENHLRPHLLDHAFAGQSISRRASYRFFCDIGGRQFDQLAGVDTLLLAVADRLGTNTNLPANWSEYLTHVNQLLTFAFAGDGLQRTKQPILDGHTLMQQLRLQPGRQVGEILDHVLEAQAAGEISTLDEALVLAHRWLDKQTN